MLTSDIASHLRDFALAGFGISRTLVNAKVNRQNLFSVVSAVNIDAKVFLLDVFTAA